MNRLHTLVRRALETTAEPWEAIRRAYGWVHRAAAILTNEPGHDAPGVRRRYRALLGAMVRHRHTLGPLAEAVEHFAKVTASYWPGLFCCYDLEDLPRTNNALEQLFGSHRHHQRLATGRHAASPMLVVRGQVQLVAAVSTRSRLPDPRELQPASVEDWQRLRAHLHQRQHRRAARTRFRRNPEIFLAHLEEQLLQPALPA